MNWITLDNLSFYTGELKLWLKKNIFSKDLIQDDQNKLVTKTQIDSWDNKFDKTSTTTDLEVEELLTPQMIKEILELATEQDIRLLFEGTNLDAGQVYNLSALTPDETKMVNMKLLSLFNDLLSQKITDNSGALQAQLQTVIDKKLDKTVFDTQVAEINRKLDTKFDKTTKLQLGSGLTGSTDFSGNVSISINTATNADIENLFTGGKV